MPSLRDVAHDGWLHTFTIQNNSSLKFHQLAAGQLLSGQPVYGTEKAGGTVRLSGSKSHMPGHTPPASQAAARRVGPAI
jgi:hypothetical protein